MLADHAVDLKRVMADMRLPDRDLQHRMPVGASLDVTLQQRRLLVLTSAIGRLVAVATSPTRTLLAGGQPQPLRPAEVLKLLADVPKSTVPTTVVLMSTSGFHDRGPRTGRAATRSDGDPGRPEQGRRVGGPRAGRDQGAGRPVRPRGRRQQAGPGAGRGRRRRRRAGRGRAGVGQDRVPHAAADAAGRGRAAGPTPRRTRGWSPSGWTGGWCCSARGACRRPRPARPEVARCR